MRHTVNFQDTIRPIDLAAMKDPPLILRDSLPICALEWVRGSRVKHLLHFCCWEPKNRNGDCQAFFSGGWPSRIAGKVCVIIAAAMNTTIRVLLGRMAIIVVTVVAPAQAPAQQQQPEFLWQGQQLMRENERIVTATGMASEHSEQKR
jgi:hypothetical protein